MSLLLLRYTRLDLLELLLNLVLHLFPYVFTPSGLVTNALRALLLSANQ